MIDELISDLLLLLTVYTFLNFWPIFQKSWRYRPPGRRRKAVRRREKIPGLTKKPDCAQCQATETEPVPPSPPPRLSPKRGPKRKVDSSGQFCPRESCRYHGWLERGNIQANGHPNGGQWRQFHCVWCHKYFSESLDTIFYRRQLPVTTICQVVASLAEGQAIQQVARVFTIEPNTVLACLEQAAQQSEAVCQYILHQLQLSQVQMDELYALLDQIQSGEVTAAEAVAQLQRPHRWVWVAMDPVSKLLVAVIVGDRSLAMAQTLVHAVVRVLAPGAVPLFLTDGLRHYATALVTHFGQWVEVPPRCEQGPQPKPRWLPIPDLLYAQVKKRRRRKRVVGVSQQVIFGAPERIKAILARSGWQINTAFVERLNLTFRGHLAALARRTIGLAKTEAGLIRQTQLWQAYYNLCLPHSALRLQLPEPVPTRGSGSPKKWQHCTPAMAAGITNQVWTVQQLLLFRVPPWRQEVAL